MIEPAIIAFSARIASGKSAVSTAVAETLGWPRAGFGDYLRGLATTRGLGSERDVLQELGASLVRDNLEQFCLDVLQSAGWVPGRGMVLDGIRHAQTVEVLKRIATPLPVFLIYLDVTDPVRNERMKVRGLSEEHVRVHEEHSTESQVIGPLRTLSDLLVDGSLPLATVTTQIVEWIQLRLHK